MLAGLTAAPLLRAAPQPRSSAPRRAAANTDGRLNVIEIVVDTLSAHYIGAYGYGNIETPNLDRLAARSTMFLDAYPEIMPTIPIRRVLYTGRRAFPGDQVAQFDDGAKFRGWHPLYAEDVTLSETFRDADYKTAIIADTHHLWKPGKNFSRGFDYFHWIRGQEDDRCKTDHIKDVDLTPWVHSSQLARAQAGLLPLLPLYLAGRLTWKSEEDWPTARLFRQASQWLDDNIDDQLAFYLHLECYSPHEFWDPPEDYYRLFMKSDYSGPRLIQSPAAASLLSPVEIEHVRALYKGYVTFVDAQIGRLLAHVEELGLMENTVIVFVTDHGTMQGEHGEFHKGEGGMRTQLTHIPFMIYDPRRAPAKIAGLVQHTDVMPTLLEVMGIQAPARVTGRSLKPYIDSGDRVPTEYIVGGWGNHGYIRTPEWLHITPWNSRVLPSAAYNELYDLTKDPLETTSILNGQPVAADMKDKLMRYVDESRSIVKGTWFTITSPEW